MIVRHTRITRYSRLLQTHGGHAYAIKSLNLPHTSILRWIELACPWSVTWPTEILRPLRAFGRRSRRANRLPITDVWSLHAGRRVMVTFSRLFPSAPAQLFHLQGAPGPFALLVHRCSPSAEISSVDSSSRLAMNSATSTSDAPAESRSRTWSRASSRRLATNASICASLAPSGGIRSATGSPLIGVSLNSSLPNRADGPESCGRPTRRCRWLMPPAPVSGRSHRGSTQVPHEPASVSLARSREPMAARRPVASTNLHAASTLGAMEPTAKQNFRNSCGVVARIGRA